MDKFATLLFFPSLLFSCSSNGSEKVTVEIESGVKILGFQVTTLNQRNFYAFRGIPYAEPPVGELRFKAPVPKKWTNNFFDGTKLGPTCVQTDLLMFKFKEITGQEDCLILNVYTHNMEEPLRKVMVFIHGGGFLLGSSNDYGPRRLLDRHVVLVTINYRLGPFGFLSTMDEASPGNYALLDQSEALKWVQRNIEAFGGDPNKVTLFGESAGSAAVINHVISPISKGLFHRAIAHSGNVLSNWAEVRDPLHWTKLLADKVDCLRGTTSAIIDCLRQTSVEQIVNAANCMNSFGAYSQYAAVVDGHFHTDLPSKLFRSGKIANKVPLLTGVMKDEGMTFLPFIYKKFPEFSDEMIAHLVGMTLNIGYERVTSDLIELIKKQYFASVDTKNDTALQEAMAAVIGDGTFVADHYVAVPILLSSGIKLFLYSFDYVTDHSIINAFGMKDFQAVSHIDDMFFLFDVPFFFPEDYERPNDRTENNFLHIWTNFAEYGYPVEETANGSGVWKSATSNNINVYHLDKVITMRKYDPLTDWRLDFWSKKVPAALYNVEKLHSNSSVINTRTNCVILIIFLYLKMNL